MVATGNGRDVFDLNRPSSIDTIMTPRNTALRTRVPVEAPAPGPAEQVQSRGPMHGDIWRTTRGTSEHFKEEKRITNLADYYSTVFDRSVRGIGMDQPPVANAVTGLLHIGADGKLIYMFREGAQMVAMDFTSERNDVKGDDHLRGFWEADFSREVLDHLNTMYQAAKLANPNLDTSKGIIKDMEVEKFGRNTRYQLHIFDANNDGKIGRGDVRLVTKEYRELAAKSPNGGPDALKLAAAQTPEVLHSRKTPLAQLGSPAVLSALKVSPEALNAAIAAPVVPVPQPARAGLTPRVIAGQQAAGQFTGGDQPAPETPAGPPRGARGVPRPAEPVRPAASPSGTGAPPAPPAPRATDTNPQTPAGTPAGAPTGTPTGTATPEDQKAELVNGLTTLLAEKLQAKRDAHKVANPTATDDDLKKVNLTVAEITAHTTEYLTQKNAAAPTPEMTAVIAQLPNLPAFLKQNYNWDPDTQVDITSGSPEAMLNLTRVLDGIEGEVTPNPGVVVPPPPAAGPQGAEINMDAIGFFVLERVKSAREEYKAANPNVTDAELANLHMTPADLARDIVFYMNQEYGVNIPFDAEKGGAPEFAQFLQERFGWDPAKGLDLTSDVAGRENFNKLMNGVDILIAGAGNLAAMRQLSTQNPYPNGSPSTNWDRVFDQALLVGKDYGPYALGGYALYRAYRRWNSGSVAPEVAPVPDAAAPTPEATPATTPATTPAATGDRPAAATAVTEESIRNRAYRYSQMDGRNAPDGEVARQNWLAAEHDERLVRNNNITPEEIAARAWNVGERNPGQNEFDNERRAILELAAEKMIAAQDAQLRARLTARGMTPEQITQAINDRQWRIGQTSGTNDPAVHRIQAVRELLAETPAPAAAAAATAAADGLTPRQRLDRDIANLRADIETINQQAQSASGPSREAELRLARQQEQAYRETLQDLERQRDLLVEQERAAGRRTPAPDVTREPLLSRAQEIDTNLQRIYDHDIYEPRRAAIERYEVLRQSHEYVRNEMRNPGNSTEWSQMLREELIRLNTDMDANEKLRSGYDALERGYNRERIQIYQQARDEILARMQDQKNTPRGAEMMRYQSNLDDLNNRIDRMRAGERVPLNERPATASRAALDEALARGRRYDPVAAEEAMRPIREMNAEQRVIDTAQRELTQRQARIEAERAIIDGNERSMDLQRQAQNEHGERLAQRPDSMDKTAALEELERNRAILDEQRARLEERKARNAAERTQFDTDNEAHVARKTALDARRAAHEAANPRPNGASASRTPVDAVDTNLKPPSNGSVVDIDLPLRPQSGGVTPPADGLPLNSTRGAAGGPVIDAPIVGNLAIDPHYVPAELPLNPPSGTGTPVSTPKGPARILTGTFGNTPPAPTGTAQLTPAPAPTTPGTPAPIQAGMTLPVTPVPTGMWSRLTSVLSNESVHHGLLGVVGMIMSGLGFKNAYQNDDKLGMGVSGATFVSSAAQTGLTMTSKAAPALRGAVAKVAVPLMVVDGAYQVYAQQGNFVDSDGGVGGRGARATAVGATGLVTGVGVAAGVAALSLTIIAGGTALIGNYAVDAQQSQRSNDLKLEEIRANAGKRSIGALPEQRALDLARAPEFRQYSDAWVALGSMSQFMDENRMNLPAGWKRVAGRFDEATVSKIDFSDTKNLAEYERALGLYVAQQKKVMDDNWSPLPSWMRLYSSSAPKYEAARANVVWAEAAQTGVAAYKRDSEQFKKTQPASGAAPVERDTSTAGAGKAPVTKAWGSGTPGATTTTPHAPTAAPGALSVRFRNEAALTADVKQAVLRGEREDERVYTKDEIVARNKGEQDRVTVARSGDDKVMMVATKTGNGYEIKVYKNNGDGTYTLADNGYTNRAGNEKGAVTHTWTSDTGERYKFRAELASGSTVLTISQFTAPFNAGQPGYDSQGFKVVGRNSERVGEFNQAAHSSEAAVPEAVTNPVRPTNTMLVK